MDGDVAIARCCFLFRPTPLPSGLRAPTEVYWGLKKVTKLQLATMLVAEEKRSIAEDEDCVPLRRTRN